MPSHSDSKIKKGSFRPLEMKAISRVGLTFGPKAVAKRPKAPPLDLELLKGTGFAATADFAKVEITPTAVLQIKTEKTRVRRYGSQAAARKAARLLAKREQQGDVVKVAGSGPAAARGGGTRPGTKSGA